MTCASGDVPVARSSKIGSNGRDKADCGLLDHALIPDGEYGGALGEGMDCADCGVPDHALCAEGEYGGAVGVRTLGVRTVGLVPAQLKEEGVLTWLEEVPPVQVKEEGVLTRLEGGRETEEYGVFAAGS